MITLQDKENTLAQLRDTIEGYPETRSSLDKLVSDYGTTDFTYGFKSYVETLSMAIPDVLAPPRGLLTAALNVVEDADTGEVLNTYVRVSTGYWSNKLVFTDSVTPSQIHDEVLGIIEDYVLNRLIVSNLDAVNRLFADIASETFRHYTVSFVSKPNTPSLVEITDDHIVFNISSDRVFTELPKKILFEDTAEMHDIDDPTKADDRRIADYNKEYARLKYTVQNLPTTISLLSAKLPLITSIVDFSGARPYKMVERTAHHIPFTSSHISKKHPVSVWYREGKTATVFSVQGSDVKVLLHPFNVSTYEPVADDNGLLVKHYMGISE